MEKEQKERKRNQNKTKVNTRIGHSCTVSPPSRAIMSYGSSTSSIPLLTALHSSCSTLLLYRIPKDLPEQIIHTSDALDTVAAIDFFRTLHRTARMRRHSVWCRLPVRLCPSSSVFTAGRRINGDWGPKLRHSLSAPLSPNSVHTSAASTVTLGVRDAFPSSVARFDLLWSGGSLSMQADSRTTHA